MKDKTLRLYPNIVKEHRDIEKRGLLALVKDHLIDLSFLEREISYSENSAGDKVAKDPEIHLELGAMQESKDVNVASKVASDSAEALDEYKKVHQVRSLTDSNIPRDPLLTPLMSTFDPPRHNTA